MWTWIECVNCKSIAVARFAGADQRRSTCSPKSATCWSAVCRRSAAWKRTQSKRRLNRTRRQSCSAASRCSDRRHRWPFASPSTNWSVANGRRRVSLTSNAPTHRRRHRRRWPRPPPRRRRRRPSTRATCGFRAGIGWHRRRRRRSRRRRRRFTSGRGGRPNRRRRRRRRRRWRRWWRRRAPKGPATAATAPVENNGRPSKIIPFTAVCGKRPAMAAAAAAAALGPPTAAATLAPPFHRCSCIDSAPSRTNRTSKNTATKQVCPSRCFLGLSSFPS